MRVFGLVQQNKIKYSCLTRHSEYVHRPEIIHKTHTHTHTHNGHVKTELIAHCRIEYYTQMYCTR